MAAEPGGILPKPGGEAQGVQREGGGLEQSSSHGLLKLTIRAPLPGEGPTVGKTSESRIRIEQDVDNRDEKKKKSLVKSWGVKEESINLRKQARKSVRKRKNCT